MCPLRIEDGQTWARATLQLTHVRCSTSSMLSRYCSLEQTLRHYNLVLVAARYPCLARTLKHHNLAWEVARQHSLVWILKHHNFEREEMRYRSLAWILFKYCHCPPNSRFVPLRRLVVISENISPLSRPSSEPSGGT